jgi:hypothetical protein
LANYSTVTRFYASADIVDLGGLNGLYTADGQDWVINDHVRVEPGDCFDGYTYLTVADGRSFFAFGTIAPNQVNQPLITGRTLALELAPDTNQLRLVAQYGYNFKSMTQPPATRTSTGGTLTLGEADFTYEDSNTYYFTGCWGVNNRVYADVTNLDTGATVAVSGTIPDSTLFPFDGGGIGFRRYGSDSYWYGLSRYEGGAGGSPANTTGGALVSPNLYYWDTGDPTIPNPFQYQSTPGTGRDISLAEITSLSQVQIIGDRVGLTARNLSSNCVPAPPEGCSGRVQVGWGPNYSGLHGSNDSSNESPGIQWYIYRQRPDEDTQRIGQSDPKRFWNSSQSDYMHLQPGRQDAYQTVHNDNQPDFHPESVINPITGEWYDLSYEASQTADGTWAYQVRTYTDRIEHLLQASVADLDPGQNPDGTHWYLAANIFVSGDQDVSNNSRWLQYQPVRNPSTGNFTFTQVGSGGVDICTMPGLTPVGRCAGATASPLVHPQGVPVRHIPVPGSKPSASTSAAALLHEPPAPIPVQASEGVDLAPSQVDLVFAGLPSETMQANPVAMEDNPVAVDHHGETASPDVLDTIYPF